jgi:xylulokinase
MGRRYLIGIDLGTTTAKCAVYDTAGTVVAEATRDMEVRYPAPGQAEQDAGDFYTVACDLIRRCLSGVSFEPAEIAAIGIDSQMGGIMSVDERFEPVTYYDTPLDSRCAAENVAMHDRLGERILALNGSIATYGPKILYWRSRPEWERIVRFLQPSAFVAGKLAGLEGEEAYMDETFLCFSGLSDLERSRWSEELCRDLGVDMGKLPRIVKSDALIGELCAPASADTGLPQGIPIAAGCGDQAAGFVGAGILSTGQMIDVSGTACILAARVPEYRFDRRHRTLACLRSALGEGYFLLSVVLGGRTHNWFVEQFGGGVGAGGRGNADGASRAGEGGVPDGIAPAAVYERLDREAAGIAPGSEGLVSINYLQGRFFPPDPYMRGLFVGHTWAHTRAHFYRSILESIAYDHYLTREIILELLPGLELGTVTAIGSGAQSRLWLQIKADVLQVPFQTLARSDLATLGSAVIAGCAVGLFEDATSLAERLSRPERVVQPKAGEQERYLPYVEIYRDLFPALKDTYRRLAGTTSAAGAGA